MSKRSITSYFTPVPSKKSRISTSSELPPSVHISYPFPIPCLPAQFELSLGGGRSKNGDKDDEEEDKEGTDPHHINDKDDLDMLYYRPLLSTYVAKELYLFLRRELPFYRVEYQINRSGSKTTVKTPRFTTIFGVDESSYFHENSGELLDAKSKRSIPKGRYRSCTPRPIPQCVDILRQYVEERTDCKYNFVLINYYADGNDSISYHSDDEWFLGENPTIASLSLGSRREFCMKHKSLTNLSLKISLSSGDMLLMRNATQRRWLHSIPKHRSTAITGGSTTSWTGGGRINITFRKAVLSEGTENYYCYNVGNGPLYRWDEDLKKMMLV